MAFTPEQIANFKRQAERIQADIDRAQRGVAALPSQPTAPRPGEQGFIGPVRPPAPRAGEPGFIGPVSPTPTRTAPTVPTTTRTPVFDPLPGQPGFNQLSGTPAFVQQPQLARPQAPTARVPSFDPLPGQPGFNQLSGTPAFVQPGQPQPGQPQPGFQQPGGQQPQGQPTGTPQFITDLEAQFQALQQSFLKLQTPSEKVLATQAQLENIITSAELGIEKVREQPIATPFITGQSAAIQRQAELSTRPLLTQLAQLQAQRQSSIDVATTQLGFAESALDRAERRIQRQSETRQEEVSLVGTSSNFRTLAKILGRQPTQDELLNFIRQRGEAGRTPERITGADTIEGGANIGGISVSDNTVSILQGFGSIGALTPSAAQAVNADLQKLGFRSDTPPPWYVDLIQQEAQQSILPELLQKEWIEYRDSILGGGTTEDRQETGRIESPFK